MPSVIAWCGFLGAWLLVAGPIFQAATELEDSDDARDVLADASANIAPQKRLSPWWWLLPPVAYVKQRHRARAYRDQLFHTLSSTQMEQFVTFSNVAVGWLMVAAGAFFIAVKETWELAEHYDWPVWVFALLVVIMIGLSTAHTVVRIRGSHRLVEESRRLTADAPADV